MVIFTALNAVVESIPDGSTFTGRKPLKPHVVTFVTKCSWLAINFVLLNPRACSVIEVFVAQCFFCTGVTKFTQQFLICIPVVFPLRVPAFPPLEIAVVQVHGVVGVR